jgi:P-type Cu+ transporter
MNDCYHCNTMCEEEIEFDNKVFCCYGCQTVYEIINQNELGKYYDLNSHPGKKKANEKSLRFDFLDLDEIKTKLLSFSEGGIEKINLNLPQIHCSSCLWLLENLHKLTEGVMSSQVNFGAKEAEITYKSDVISLRELAELLSNIGYPPAITLEDEKKKPKKDSKLVRQIGLVGFCFGNIMLYSFPEYLGLDERDASFQNIFNWLNVALSIPILIFGARQYIVSAYKSLKYKVVNIDVPISIGIFALYSRSLFEVISGQGAGYFDSFAGLIFFLLIGKWFQNKTFSAMNFERDFKSYFPIAITRLLDKGEEIVPIEKLEKGDRLLIRNQELIPADAILINGKGNIDYSFVSGESNHVKKNSGDVIYAGGRQVGSALTIELTDVVENSYLTRLWNNPIFKKKVSVKDFSNTVSKYFTLFILVLAAVSGFVWMQIDSTQVAFIITSILIVACPCAIALSIPFTYGNSMRVLSKKSFFMRSAKVIDPLTEITDVIFDKTGTLTCSDEMSIEWVGDELTLADKAAVYEVSRQSTHPLSRKISNYLKSSSANIELAEFIETEGKGLSATIKNVAWKIGSASLVGAKSKEDFSQVFLKKNQFVLGYFKFGNKYRPNLEGFLSSLNKQYNLHVLSGDNESETENLKLINSSLNLNFNQSPQDKFTYVSELQDAGKKVLMLGDGLNDAGAIKKADVGIAVVDDIYSFSPSSDVILDGQKMTSLNKFLDFASRSRNIVWLSYAFSLVYNLVGIYFAVSGQLTPLIAAILMPLSSISVVLLVTFLTNIYGKKILA